MLLNDAGHGGPYMHGGPKTIYARLERKKTFLYRIRFLLQFEIEKYAEDKELLIFGVSF